MLTENGGNVGGYSLIDKALQPSNLEYSADKQYTGFAIPHTISVKMFRSCLY